ncbi:MAG: hypothetical protein A2Y62_05625 [Candidatus Fischerbacteria bacterium RBG_13_37_8]|uniref:Uncharacterized protein n=1 Tax=Candidatus Fischerbacteria bacterium RBG_13_37_8 TaxID=1817863 RepID=A0A1F5VXH8_9BACT|nr:MAG: hypothetical protein A2Y62_05625 [Candidatus Fischerbacteria bacterium RBG_13_37_8]
MNVKIKYNPTAVDVVDIVKQVKQQIQDKQQETKNDDKLKLLISEKFKEKVNSLAFPQDVKDDLLKTNFNMVFSTDSLTSSERPVIGTILKITRTIFKPFLKLFINIDPLLHHLHRQSYLLMLYKEVLIDLSFEIEKIQSRSPKKLNQPPKIRRFMRPPHPKKDGDRKPPQ